MILSNGTPKIVDFGLAIDIKLTSGSLTSGPGTAFYKALEIIFNEYDEKIDVYRCFLFLFTFQLGHDLFRARLSTQLFGHLGGDTRVSKFAPVS